MTLQSAHTIYREAIRWKGIDIIFIQMARNENLESKSKKKSKAKFKNGKFKLTLAS